MKPPSRRQRWSAIILGICFFIWLPFEDSSPVLAILFAVCICGLAASWAAGLLKHNNWNRGWLAGIIGVMAGFFVSLSTLILMAFKTGVHGHSAPDFTPDQILLIIKSTPLFMVSGALIGLGVVAWERGARL